MIQHHFPTSIATNEFAHATEPILESRCCGEHAELRVPMVTRKLGTSGSTAWHRTLDLQRREHAGLVFQVSQARTWRQLVRPARTDCPSAADGHRPRHLGSAKSMQLPAATKTDNEMAGRSVRAAPVTGRFAPRLTMLARSARRSAPRPATPACGCPGAAVATARRNS